MGKKRTRVPGQPRAAVGGDLPPVQHAQTLEDDVREQRDVQFASEKKQTERSKRRKLAEERASASKPTSRNANARTLGLQVWRNAAARRKLRNSEDTAEDDDPSRDADVDDKTGAKIVEQARQQRKEIRDEVDGEKNKPKNDSAIEKVLKGLGEKDAVAPGSDDSDDDGRSMADTEKDWHSTVGDDERDMDFLDGSKITEEEEIALALFSNPATDGAEDDKRTIEDSNGEKARSEGKVMLADIILAKIQEKEQADARAAAMAANPERAERDRKISEVYNLVGNIMSRYRSGKVPKAFKVIPKFPHWEDLIYKTRPDEWTPAAVNVATRVLASNLSGKEVVRYYSDILLPRCLEDIADNKKLNYHLYRALTKSIYKPDAFSKGILFPLCEDRSVTFRQASIIGSVVSTVSIPMLHSAAALLYISQLPFSATTCIIMKSLIEKKYALPYRVVDAVVGNFLEMKNDTRPMPLLWHQCLLSFAQRYKTELTVEQKEKLKLLMRVHTHAAVTPEIRRELFSARNRGEYVDPDANTIARNIANASAMVD